MPDDGQTLDPGTLAADAHARQVKAMTSGGTASKSKPQYQHSTATFENFADCLRQVTSAPSSNTTKSPPPPPPLPPSLPPPPPPAHPTDCQGGLYWNLHWAPYDFRASISSKATQIYPIWSVAAREGIARAAPTSRASATAKLG